jgi:hypothetical protein
VRLAAAGGDVQSQLQGIEPVPAALDLLLLAEAGEAASTSSNKAAAGGQEQSDVMQGRLRAVLCSLKTFVAAPGWPGPPSASQELLAAQRLQQQCADMLSR